MTSEPRAGALHLVFGPQGAGKSTYARALAAREGGVHLAIDDWMGQLFGPDLPRPPDLPWIMARVQRCEARIWATADAVARRGTPVVLDPGFVKRASRAGARARAADAGLATAWHFATADAAVRRARVPARNAARGETFAFEVTPAMFAYMEREFEPPHDDELAGVRVVATD